MKLGIFINYRRADTGHVTARIFERLRVAFPQHRVFMDLEEIPLGVKYAEHISKTLTNCAVTLVVIGPTWENLSEGIWPFRRRRLHAKDDLVRTEIEHSLQNEVDLIPVLVDVRMPPRASVLPPSLRPIRDYQSFTLTSAEFKRDVEDLVKSISTVLRLEDAVQTGPRLKRVLESKKLRAGCVKHPPLSDFNWISRDKSEASGLYIEMCRQVCKDAGLELELVPVDWADIPHRVFSEMGLDLVLSVFQTPERARVNNFTACFHKVNIVGLVRKDYTAVNSIADIRDGDCRVVVTKGEAGWEFAQHNLQLPKHRLIVVENADLGAMMSFVETGTADLAICDEVSCAEYERKSPKVRRVFADDPLDLCKNCVMVPPQDEEWRAWVGEQFEKARKVAAIQEMEKAVLADPTLFIRAYQ